MASAPGRSANCGPPLAADATLSDTLRVAILAATAPLVRQQTRTAIESGFARLHPTH